MTRDAENMVDLFFLCHSTATTGMGGVSINLAHLPFAGTVLNQPAKLLRCFGIIKSAVYRQVQADSRVKG